MLWLGNLQGRWLQAGITLTCGVAFMLFGYDQGVFGGLLGNAMFIRTFNNPNPTIQGQIVSTFDLGCILGAATNLYTGDKLGRKKAIIVACGLVVLGSAIQASSFSLAQMIVGRIVAGFGIGSETAIIPMYQAETCNPKHRGKLIALQCIIVISGIVLTNWMNLGFTYVPDNDVSWRFPLAFQTFFALLAMFLILFTPESPRWLCMKDRHEEARRVIARLEGQETTNPEVSQFLQILIDTIAHERSAAEVSWREVFSNGEQQTFRRITLGAGLNFMQQMGGINVVVYYMPVVLTTSFDFSDRLALILTACDFIALMIWGGFGAVLIDRWGRKKLLLLGSVIQGTAFSVAAAGLGVGTRASNGVAVAFIFLYHLGFGLSFLCVPFTYAAEINSNRMRNIGAAIGMLTNWLFVYVVVLITPTGIANIGWRYYIIFGALNFSFIPVIWYFYIETAAMSLEEIDKMFEAKFHGGKSMTWNEARQAAKQSMAAAKAEISAKIGQDGVDGVVVHEEYSYDNEKKQSSPA
ncbi:hypothetical protein AYL99_08574 [Fonsecaea erecta]|uniref:Major facilitator superfamily (MFS) profile domain-containing protein n=1 Tax=Fonsecaea erecta TaxID=1367422 RepID=A0A178ZED3_9EURO|nr:hypothetical protein AYL99_08574 [Fonsecaea erecta]OAP57836.1 hypothetical protein AYL99_08574 [Fonsecaea erecta]